MIDFITCLLIIRVAFYIVCIIGQSHFTHWFYLCNYSLATLLEQPLMKLFTRLAFSSNFCEEACMKRLSGISVLQDKLVANIECCNKDLLCDGHYVSICWFL